MSHYMQRIDSQLHERMKSLAKTKGTSSVTEEYRQAIENWLAQENQSIILEDSQILSTLENRIAKGEERLVKMIVRMGMDVDIAMIGILNMLAEERNEEVDDIYSQIRPVAAKYFARSRKESLPEE